MGDFMLFHDHVSFLQHLTEVTARFQRKRSHGFDFGNADCSEGSFLRNSSMTARESSELLMTTGVIIITNSVRIFDNDWLPKSPPNTGIFDSSGNPCVPELVSFFIRPASTMGSPDATFTTVLALRVEMFGLVPAAAPGAGELIS